MQNKLNKEQRDDIAALAAMKDSEIDSTVVPEVLDWRGAGVGRYLAKEKDKYTASNGREEESDSVG